MSDKSLFEKMMAIGMIAMGIFYVVLPLLSFLFGTTKDVGFATTNPANNPSLFSFAFGSFIIIVGLALYRERTKMARTRIRGEKRK